jgi:hypothetical protein
VNLLLVLPLLPLAVALWVALWPRSGELALGRLVALVAAFPVAAAAFAPRQRLEVPELLLRDSSALVLDEVSRAGLFLFGGAWLAAGLLLSHRRAPWAPAIPLLVALSGATTLALAEGGPLVYAGMLATGYGLYAVMACEPGVAWRRPGRALIVLLVASDLLVFETLLTASADPGTGATPGLLLLGLAAFILRGAVPPAHAWLPPALAVVAPPTALLLVGMPTGMAVFGALKILPQGAPELAVLCLALGLAGASWAALAGLAQVQGRTTLGYAGAATAALLLLALPAGAGTGGHLAWLALALLACCTCLPLVALQRAGWVRDGVIAAVLLLHGLAGGQAAVHGASVLPGRLGLLAPLAAVAATLLLTVAARRMQPAAVDDDTPDIAWLAFGPIALAFIGLAAAWAGRGPEFASAWIAPVAISIGLTCYQFMPARTEARIPPGDLLGPVERWIGFLIRATGVICRRRLPRVLARAERALLRLWDGERWSQRVHRLDLMLRDWSATGVMMLLFALGATLLLAR